MMVMHHDVQDTLVQSYVQRSPLLLSSPHDFLTSSSGAYGRLESLYEWYIRFTVSRAAAAWIDQLGFHLPIQHTLCTWEDLEH